MKHKVFSHLDKLEIKYTNYEHKPVFTCDDCREIDIPGERVKSLLLRNKNASKYYMVVLQDEKSLDSKLLRKLLGEAKLSFASEERMIAKIGVKPGHVSPFANLNDDAKDIKVIFDEALKYTLIGFHPMQNDNTTVLKIEDVEKFLQDLGVEYEYMKL